MINNLDSNKVHAHDMISIRMLKLCCPSFCKPLLIIFLSHALVKCNFLCNGKKPVHNSHKNNDK